MKVVIDIPKNDYWLACNYPEALISIYAHYIKKGVPLPKKHGRLVDADALIAKCGDWYTEEGTEEGFIGTIEALLKDTPTVIEAEGEEWK